jgi:hypothetical protein
MYFLDKNKFGKLVRLLVLLKRKSDHLYVPSAVPTGEKYHIQRAVQRCDVK